MVLPVLNTPKLSSLMDGKGGPHSQQYRGVPDPCVLGDQ